MLSVRPFAVSGMLSAPPSPRAFAVLPGGQPHFFREVICKSGLALIANRERDLPDGIIGRFQQMLGQIEPQ